MYKYTHDTVKEERLKITEFKGLCEKVTPEKGEFEALYGFTSSGYPSLTTGVKRRNGDEKSGGKPLVFVSDKIGYVNGNGTLYYGSDVKTNFLAAVTSNDNRFCVMLGAYAAFFPDKKWYNTETGESGRMDLHKSYSVDFGDNIAVTLKFDDGTIPTAYTYSVSEPANPVNGQLWCKKQDDGSILAQRYFSSGECWIVQDKLWYCISATGIHTDIAVGDYVGVSECKSTEKKINNFSGTMKVASVSNDTVCLEFKAEIWLCAHICRENPHSYSLTDIRFDRNIPDFAYVTASGNRLWGCSADGHEIRASALGSVSTWERFDGYETDSWAVEIGSYGKFTGCAVRDSQPIFFKENEVITVFGSKPSAFSTSSLSVTGVKNGFGKSLCCVQGTLYYMGANGIYKWNGGSSKLVSRYIDTDCDECFCASVGEKYYILTRKNGNAGRLLCYDTSLGVWHTMRKTDSILLFANATELFGVEPDETDGHWHFVSLDRMGDNTQIDTVTFTDDTDKQFEFVTGNILPFDKNSTVSQICVDCKIAKGAFCGVFALENDFSVPFTLGFIYGDGKRKRCTLTFPQNVCYSLKLNFKGNGELTLYGISVKKSEA